MSESTLTPVRWSALTPGMPMRLNRLRFAAGDTGSAGTAGAGGDAAAQAAAAAATAATDAASLAAAAAAGAAGDKVAWDGKVESLDPGVQKMITDLRKENADRRTKLTTAEQAQQQAIRALAKAAGIDIPGDEQAPDPAALAAQVAASQTTARTAQVELAVYRAAGALQGDPNALLDSRTFLTKVADLDPAAADFQTSVTAAIQAALTENPKLKAAQATGASSVNHTGGTGELTDIDAQIAAATAAGNYTLAIALKRQKATS